MTRAVVLALASAALFGASTPAAKALLGAVDPIILAGLLYCGAGLGVSAVRRIARPLFGFKASPERPLSRSDAGWLAGAIFAGGIVGPLLLMFGLSRTEASTASLLLTFEALATALLAWFVFHENFDRRVAIGMIFLVVGALVLSWTGQPSASNFVGPAAVVGACLVWGLDNNFTKKVSLADPLQIVELKGLIAGPVNLILGLAAGASLPAASSASSALVVGFFGYGVSLILFVFALRDLGTARTGAYFSTAPFIGAVVAIGLLGEPFTMQLAIAGGLMAVGVWLHLTERHEHEHEHPLLVHAHSHVHDEHHSHEHGSNDPPGEPHSHVHRHPPTQHTHVHTPDMHHTHRH
jgi:drug/metabolite transporter (DMT)-like permease